MRQQRNDDCPECTMSERIITIEQRVGSIAEGVAEQKAILLGKDNRPGVVARVQRLENWITFEGRTLYAALGTVGGIAATIVAFKLKGVF